MSNPEQVIDNQMDDLEGKSPEDLQAMLDQEISGAKEPVVEGAKEDQSPEKTPDAAPANDLAERIALLEKRLNDKDSFIQQRNAEIGLLRKENRLLKNQRPPELDIPDEEFHANPKEAVKKALHLAKQREEEEREANAKHEQEARANYRAAIDQWSPDFDKKVPELSEIMKRDQAPDQLVQQFRSDPVATLNPAVVFQMLKRLDAEKKIAELEEKLKAASKQTAATVSKIQNAGRAKPVTTSAAPSSTRSFDNLTEDDIDKMSYEELQKVYKQL